MFMISAWEPEKHINAAFLIAKFEEKQQVKRNELKIPLPKECLGKQLDPTEILNMEKELYCGDTDSNSDDEERFKKIKLV